MKFLLQSFSGQNRCLIRALGRRYCAAASTEEYSKRNYANNLSEYNTVVNSITAQRRSFLLRDVYDDMILDGVKPSADIFHSLVVGVMKRARLQDALFFREEMKTLGIAPDVNLYNFLISTCGKCKNSNEAIRVFEEMKRYEVKPNAQTYICLLNACAAAGRLDRVYAIVRDMTAAGAGLNRFCYAGLITAHLNKVPRQDDLSTKILELVEQSKGWSSVDASRRSAENMMYGVSEEELYNTPTAEYTHRPRFFQRNLTVYHVAFSALADLKDVKALEALLEMLKQDGHETDTYMVIQIIRCYLHSGDLDTGLKWFEDYMSTGKAPVIELYTTLVEGAMVGYTPKGMQLAQDTLVQMNDRNFFLDPKNGAYLLEKAAGEKTGGYTTANYIWDLMQARKIIPTLPAAEAYYKGLKEREIPQDDPRLMLVTRTYDSLRLRVGTGSTRQ
ncbi:PREDICTED: pentatricopeptide repeat-containing protein At4g35850, mitochondrial [Tarenaya hassleriana]|uniref:pentatricopeptide repeat-containing protein At4g35850, mitochondrial n=1 Tax=Tarenaya hassleriana TaxID=28532 RepID=UPI00053C550F|nr:PREDICTED: pentatricopeptide repeat-containing protein At4g35850, mitochondrial [Tarenaya hassleriana]